jgi:hypothetical protein
MDTRTPRAGSLPASTKQYDAPVLTPVPSGSGQLICAGSTLGGGGGAGFRAGARRRCASASEAATSNTSAAITLTVRMFEV